MHWPAFPDFKVLTLEDKESYTELVKEYPSISDITFSTLHIWWNLEGKLRVSTLNNNLVIDYRLPFDEANSGLALIGRNKIDESVAEIFNYLREHKQPLKLLHVPEFTVEALAKPEAFNIEEELDYHEYIMDSQALASLEGHDHSRTRRKVNRFLREVDGKELEIKSLDLSQAENRTLIQDSIKSWQAKHPKGNDPENTELQALNSTLDNSQHFDTQNLCLFIDGQLMGVALFHRSTDHQHFIINHLKVDYSIPFIFDFMTSQIAEYAVKHKVPYMNMEMDLGIEGLRRHKQGLRPVKYFKKYRLSPKI